VSLEKALKALMNLGLAETEAQVYIYLAKKGSHAEEDLAKVLKISNQSLRQILNNLQKKGFVIPKTEKQIIYIAVPLERIIDNIMKIKIEATQRFEQDKLKFLSI
jgi:sugar-specific transcriptional regulator TrmB